MGVFTNTYLYCVCVGMVDRKIKKSVGSLISRESMEMQKKSCTYSKNSFCVTLHGLIDAKVYISSLMMMRMMRSILFTENKLPKKSGNFMKKTSVLSSCPCSWYVFCCWLIFLLISE